MPRPPKKSKGSKPIKPKTTKRVKRSDVPEYASLSCKRTLAGNSPTGNFSVNQLYNLMNTQLVDYQRAVQVAQAYQHYRIKNIKLTFKPTYDTFQAGTSKMNLYYMLDKSGSIPTNVSLEGLKQMGARPFALDENPKIVSWAPTVLESTMYQPGLGNDAPSKYKISPWLSTKSIAVSPGAFIASGIDHLGIYWWCEQFLTPTATEYMIEVEVQFQFKKPLANNLTTTTEAYPARLAEINDSPDGIVGGKDGV